MQWVHNRLLHYLAFIRTSSRASCNGAKVPLYEAILPDTRSRLAALSLAFVSLLFASVFGLAFPKDAYGVWPLPSESGISLGYLCEYASASGQTHVHHGVDIPASDESHVSSPVDGTVSFVGYVPSDEVSGSETMLAVSVTMDDGRVVTLMPFESVDVKQGANVSQGRELGRLASHGDKSSSTTHLHVGLKRGRTYYDPSGILGIEIDASSSTQARGAEVGIGASAGAGLGLDSSAGVAAGSCASATAGVVEDSHGSAAIEAQTTSEESAGASDEPVTIESPISAEVLDAYLARGDAADSTGGKNALDGISSWFSDCVSWLSFAVSSTLETLGAKGIAVACAFASSFILLAIYLAAYRRERDARTVASEDITVKKGHFRRIFVRLIKRFRPLAN